MAKKSFEIGGHWPLWRGWKNDWPRRTDKSRTIKKWCQSTFGHILFYQSTIFYSHEYSVRSVSGNDYIVGKAVYEYLLTCLRLGISVIVQYTTVSVREESWTSSNQCERCMFTIGLIKNTGRFSESLFYKVTEGLILFEL